MPVEIPLSPAGERFVTVNVGTQVLLFRTYFVCGQDRHWLLDIRDAQNKPLFSGINLVPGVDNLLKGRGDVLHDCQLRVRLAVPAAGREAFYGKPDDPGGTMLRESRRYAGTEKALDAPGNSFALIWYGPGETNPEAPLDPMETIGQDDWETSGVEQGDICA